MAGLKGKSGPPGNMNTFKHGLAAVQKRREESITIEHEESARQQILVSWQKGNAGMPYTPGNAWSKVRMPALPEAAGVAESDMPRTYFGHNTPWLPATTVPMPL